MRLGEIKGLHSQPQSVVRSVRLRKSRKVRYFRQLISERLEERTLLAAGDLDRSFGLEGRLATDFTGAGQDALYALVQQPDGKLVAVGTSTSEAILTRYQANGVPDLGFGDGGVVRTWLDEGKQVALQADGRILVGGALNGGQWDMGVMRYHADGKIDTSFGAGGLAIVNFGADDRLCGLALQSDGKIVLAGTTGTNPTKYIALARLLPDGSLDSSFGTGGLSITATVSSTNAAALDSAGRIVVTAGVSGMAAYRYLANGALDTTFGSGGLSAVALSGSGSVASVAVQSDGRIVLAGNTYDSSTNTISGAITRLTEGGAIDGSLGAVTASIGSYCAFQAVLVQGDGKIVAAGAANSGSGTPVGFALARYLSNGALDTGFDGDGKVTTAFASRPGSSAAAMIWDGATGELVAAGYVPSDDAGNDLALVRYLGNGSLDTGFGSGGMVASNVAGSGQDDARAMVRQSDGKLLVVGSNNSSFGVARYLSDGQLDVSFGAGGRVSTPFTQAHAYDVAVQGDGKIVVAGISPSAASNSDFALARYHVDGTLDASFGVGGKVLLDINSGEANYCYAIAIQGDGKIVAVGFTKPTSGWGQERLAAVRFNSNGSLDPGFGSSGVVVTDVSPGYTEQANDVMIDAAGRIVLAVYAYLLAPNANSLVVVRYRSDGTLDSAFSGDGIAVLPASASSAAQRLALDSAGRILVAGGRIPSGLVLARWRDDGTVDPSFGVGGISSLVPPNNASVSVGGMSLQPDGKIVVAGGLGAAGAGGKGDFLLLRCGANGNLDTSLGNQGYLTADFNGGSDWGVGVALEANGKIVVAGTATMNATGRDFAMARFRGDGSPLPGYGDLDPTFDFDGRASTMLPSWSNREWGHAVAVQADGKILAAGKAENDFALARFLADGQPDPSFGIDGRVATDLRGTDVDPEQIHDLAIQADGKIVAAGETDVGYIGVVRYLADGKLDSSFGTGGTVKFGFTAAGGAIYGARGVVLLADGKIVLAGTAELGGTNTGDFGLARLHPDGTLDTTFGTGGIVITPFPGNGVDDAYDVALQSDGKIVVAGTTGGGTSIDMAIARYNNDGTLDDTFGDGGLATADLYSWGVHDQVRALAVQPDGKLLVAGYCSPTTAGSDFEVTRFLPNGTLDSTFGSGGMWAGHIPDTTSNEAYSLALQSDGKILFGGRVAVEGSSDYAIVRLRADGGSDGSVRFYTANSEWFNALALQADGKIVLVGTSANMGETESDMVVWRLNPELDEDPSFGGTGSLRVIGFPVMSSATGEAAVFQPDGKLVVVGQAGQATDLVGTALGLTRLLPDGSTDTDFGFEGFARTDFWYQSGTWSGDEIPHAVALQADGRIVVAGRTQQSETNTDFALARYTSAGTRDATWSGDGVSNSDFGGSDEEARAVVVQADGQLVVAGASNAMGTPDFAIARYRSDGSLDTTFAQDGYALFEFGSAQDDRAWDLAIQADGRLVVVGETGTSRNRQFAVARLLSNGTLDTSFGGDGLVTTSIGGTIDIPRAVAIQPDGKIVVAGETNRNFGSSNVDFALVRYNADGNLDTSFGTGGIVTTDFWYITDRAYDVRILTNGHIMVGGMANGGSFAVACYRPDGTPDALFGAAGWRTTSFGATSVANTVSVQTDGKVVLAGKGNNQAAVARFLMPSPPVAVTLSPAAVAENQPAGTRVGALTSADPDTGDSFTYSLVAGAGDADNGAFAIVGDQLVTAAVFDYEGHRSRTIRVRSTDQSGLWHEESLSIAVTDVNEAPSLGKIGDRIVDEQTPLTFVVTATDPDRPSQTLAFSLDAISLAAGMAINESTGVFAWTPSEAQQGQYVVTFTAADDGTPPLSDSEAVTITVREVNDPPVLATIGNRSVDEETQLQFTVTAGNENDTPPNHVELSVADLPQGASFDPATGVFAWTPSEAQQGQYVVTFTAADDGTPPLSDSEAVTITVREVNDPPVLATIGNKSVARSQVLTFTAAASDADEPVELLTFSLDASSIALGMTINATTGDFCWTPAFPLGPGDYSVTVTVADNGDPVLSDSETMTIIVLVSWQNPQHPCDVTGDGLVDPDDVLLLINYINANEFGDLATASPPVRDPPPFLDPSGDGSISPLDVLIVINYINTYESGPIPSVSAGEGEQDGPSDHDVFLPIVASGVRSANVGFGSVEGSVLTSTRSSLKQFVWPASMQPASKPVSKLTRSLMISDELPCYGFEISEIEGVISTIARDLAQARNLPREA